MTIRAFEGAVHLPGPMPVHATALGLQAEVTIGDFAVAVALPYLDENGKLRPNVSPGKLPGVSQALASFAGGPPEWGYLGPPEEGLYVITNLAISVQLPVADTGDFPADRKFSDLSGALYPWLDIVTDWVTAWSEVPVRELRQESLSHVLALTALRGFVVCAGPSTEVTSRGATGLSRRQVESAFERASAGDQLPPEHKLLHSATAAGVSRDLRRAVIEACTASEVALATAIKQHLAHSGVAEDFIEAALADANGLVGLISLYTSLGYDSPISKNKAQGQLARTRNLAAHTGAVPTDEETELALNHAWALVNSVCPLPDT